ncbi:DUF2975 domain-containing protein [Microcella flavibacter]|uniref:DUF2975 domain-containing protein n=1 Tax=Microcella flavibacter TaxID=1804990 RepID=UPI00145726F7|nr:DUF2975 domain-containing protein [Microcella flavibacter]
MTSSTSFFTAGLVMALRVVIALSLLGSLLVQGMILPLVWEDLAGAPELSRTLFVLLIGAGVVTLQVSAVCIWRLLTMVRRGSVFSRAAFRYVDVIIGAILVAAALMAGLGLLLVPGGVAPGVVGLIGGAALVIGGVALLMVVMRVLLAQAVERETEARALRSELQEVI